MKLLRVFIASTVLLFVSACSQDKEEMTQDVEVITSAGEEAVETFATATLINPNTANADVIAAIPGIDAELAAQVVSARPYATPTELNAILKDSVDQDVLKTIYTAMFVTVDLNTGNNADYQLIPTSLSPRKLAHEFEEYRPYSSMDQFSREMSKYVSDEEVAFLRRYVTIN